MPTWGIFYFLWDDPLFTNQVGNPKDYVDDPEFIELRRTLRLLALELLHLKIARLERQLTREKQRHREAQAREIWTINRFIKHLPREVIEGILIERKVNELDEDFSFIRAIGDDS